MTNDIRTLVSAAEARAAARTADDLVRGAAERDGHIDVALGTLDSPIGELFVAVTPRGLACVAFEGEDRDVLARRFASALSPRVLTAVHMTEDARRQLGEYFEGTRQHFELRLDRRLMTSFAREVLGATARVPFGQVATYGAVAKQIGKPKAARAVGAALGSNPIPIVVPCHRVIGASGTLTGYAGGLDRKAFLLHLEGDPTLPGM
jgi:methylated-DNA-[protein]-cysteine S-methyltransferase